MKKIFFAVLAIGIGIVTIYFIGNSNLLANILNKNERFVISAQSNTDEIVIDRVVMDKPGFIVIREVINDRPGQITEISDFLESGVSTNVTISLRSAQEVEAIDISGGFPVLKNLVAIVYTDDGDKGFNPLTDSVAYYKGDVLARYVNTGEIASESTVVPNTKANSEDPIAAEIIYTDEGFSPNTVEIKKGDTVAFINESSGPMWVASNVHPAHTILPTFDQFGTSAFGERYTYTFQQSGEWEYHDHVNASKIGLIIVR
tara:strand:+ start:2202 stop:2978 length:777 start_codon:yes stop_codon:yes gene_type:complete